MRTSIQIKSKKKLLRGLETTYLIIFSLHFPVCVIVPIWFKAHGIYSKGHIYVIIKARHP